jgi:hypothetical protein
VGRRQRLSRPRPTKNRDPNPFHPTVQSIISFEGSVCCCHCRRRVQSIPFNHCFCFLVVKSSSWWLVGSLLVARSSVVRLAFYFILSYLIAMAVAAFLFPFHFVTVPPGHRNSVSASSTSPTSVSIRPPRKSPATAPG